MTTIYLAQSKRGKATFTIDYSPALRMFKLTFDQGGKIESQLSTTQTLATDIDRLKNRLRHYDVIENDVKTYLP